jgi:activator of HSP90 ATPase
MTVNLDKAKEDQNNIIKATEKANELYLQNAFGEKNVLKKIIAFLNTKEENLIQTVNNDIQIHNERVNDLNRRIDNKAAIRKTMCPKCEIDFAKSTEYEEGGVFTSEKPGKIVMKTGDVTEFYESGKIWTLKDGFLGIGDTTFKSYNEMLNYFLKKCKEKYFCN